MQIIAARSQLFDEQPITKAQAACLKSTMPRQLSFWILLALIIAVGVFFWQVIRPFMLAIFMALVLAVLFSPMHQWLTRRLGSRHRIAAACSTLIVLLLVMLPISFTMLMAGTQLLSVGKDVVTWLDDRSAQDLQEIVDEVSQTNVGRTIQDVYSRISQEQREQIHVSATRLAESATTELVNKTRGFLSNIFMFVVGSAVMILSLYYFLADRDVFLRELHRLLPLEVREERLLEDKFQSVCRGVVLGTIVAGVVQAALNGAVLAIIGVPQLWLLIVLTMFFSFIPFLGSAVIWFPISLFLIVNQHYTAGIGLMIFGAAVISTSDNLVRAYVLGSQARLHPLVALVTALGAIQVVGLWGIFIGPMVAAFLYALLNMVQERIDKTKVA